MDDMKWVAEYAAGCLPQYNADGTQNRYQDIDRAKLVRFVLLKVNRAVFILNVPKGSTLIYRRRVAMGFSGIKEVVYIVGTKRTLNFNQHVQDLHFIFEDGHIETTDRFDKDHQWFYPISFLPEERNG